MDFYERAKMICENIPRGRVATYGQIALLCGRPRNARQVGYALNKGWLGDLSMRQILVMAAFSLYFGFASTGVDNTAHVGGMVSGFFLAVIFYHPGRKI